MLVNRFITVFSLHFQALGMPRAIFPVLDDATAADSDVTNTSISESTSTSAVDRTDASMVTCSNRNITVHNNRGCQQTSSAVQSVHEINSSAVCKKRTTSTPPPIVPLSYSKQEHQQQASVPSKKNKVFSVTTTAQGKVSINFYYNLDIIILSKGLVWCQKLHLFIILIVLYVSEAFKC